MTMAVVATTNKRTLAVMAATDDNQLKLSSPSEGRASLFYEGLIYSLFINVP